MSTNLYWRPAPQNQPPALELPAALKHVIAQRFWGHDGSLRADEVEVSKDWVPYLEGLEDAGVAGAAELLLAIASHDRVMIWIGEGLCGADCDRSNPTHLSNEHSS